MCGIGVQLSKLSYSSWHIYWLCNFGMYRALDKHMACMRGGAAMYPVVQFIIKQTSRPLVSPGEMTTISCCFLCLLFLDILRFIVFIVTNQIPWIPWIPWRGSAGACVRDDSILQSTEHKAFLTTCARKYIMSTIKF